MAQHVSVFKGRTPKPPLAGHPAAINVVAPFPRKFEGLLGQSARYKVYYGGRGGAKSWAIARALLIRGLKGGLRVLCTREVQATLEESSYQLLIDQIRLLGLGPKSEGGSGSYRWIKNKIFGPAGTSFIFKGLQDPNALKSAEGVDVCWIEEANIVTEGSWLKLDPTVRKPGSEIWISFNPELPTDYLYRLFVTDTKRKLRRPPHSLVQKITWRDNPWFPQELRTQKDEMRATDFDKYLWVWEGQCLVALDGAVYAKQLRKVQAEGRITRVPIQASKPVHMFLDLGRGDMTAIWFVQIVGLEYRVLHYYQNSGEHFDHYLRILEDLKEERGWFYGTMWLPHDAEHEHLAAKRTIKQQAQDAGYRVRMVPNVRIADGIEAARVVMAQCWFDEEHCSEGIGCLRNYHYEVEEDGTRSKAPEHDWSSHGADGFRYMGVALKDDAPKPKMKAKVRPAPYAGRHGWLGR